MYTGVKVWKKGKYMHCKQCSISEEELNDWLYGEIINCVGWTLNHNTIKFMVTGDVYNPVPTIMTKGVCMLYDRFFVIGATLQEVESMIATVKYHHDKSDYLVLKSCDTFVDFHF